MRTPLGSFELPNRKPDGREADAVSASRFHVPKQRVPLSVRSV